jgi:hypothetical protein
VLAAGKFWAQHPFSFVCYTCYVLCYVFHVRHTHLEHCHVGLWVDGASYLGVYGDRHVCYNIACEVMPQAVLEYVFQWCVCRWNVAARCDSQQLGCAGARATKSAAAQLVAEIRTVQAGRQPACLDVLELLQQRSHRGLVLKRSQQKSMRPVVLMLVWTVCALQKCFFLCDPHQNAATTDTSIGSCTHCRLPLSTVATWCVYGRSSNTYVRTAGSSVADCKMQHQQTCVGLLSYRGGMSCFSLRYGEWSFVSDVISAQGFTNAVPLL